ncbi:hypothetical protein BC629DRAFT_940894 [Irpex lacteus]|nr:hypothetical protein BC629DRAFT_940894 [Irpex lacteus]
MERVPSALMMTGVEKRGAGVPGFSHQGSGGSGGFFCSGDDLPSSATEDRRRWISRFNGIDLGCCREAAKELRSGEVGDKGQGIGWRLRATGEICGPVTGEARTLGRTLRRSPWVNPRAVCKRARSIALDEKAGRRHVLPNYLPQSAESISGDFHNRLY